MTTHAKTFSSQIARITCRLSNKGGEEGNDRYRNFSSLLFFSKIQFSVSFPQFLRRPQHRIVYDIMYHRFSGVSLQTDRQQPDRRERGDFRRFFSSFVISLHTLRNQLPSRSFNVYCCRIYNVISLLVRTVRGREKEEEKRYFHPLLCCFSTKVQCLRVKTSF